MLPFGQVRKFSLLNDYSLDAPLIAIAWQFVIERSISCDLSVYHYFILGISVWLAYSADRFSEPMLPKLGRARRHEIFKRHKSAFYSFWFAGFLIILSCAINYLEVECFLYGLTLFALCFLNFILCRFEARFGFASSCTKEFRTACILSLGCLFFPFYETDLGFQELLCCWLILFCLFLINCLCVSKWEWFEDESRNRLSWLQKRPECLKKLAMGKYPFAVVVVILFLMDGLDINLFMHALSVTSFVLFLDFFSSDEQGKREAIDLGYWIIPLTLIGIEDVLGL